MPASAMYAEQRLFLTSRSKISTNHAEQRELQFRSDGAEILNSEKLRPLASAPSPALQPAARPGRSPDGPSSTILFTGLSRAWKNGAGYRPIQNAMMISGTSVANLAQVQIRQLLIRRILELAEHRPLVEPQHVRRAQHDAGAAGNGPPQILLEGAHHDRELADEPVQQRQSDRRHRHDQEDDRIDRA